MRILLDTHVLLWWLANDPRLGRPGRDLIAGAAEASVSTASAWEMSLKAKLGKLDCPDDLDAQLVRHRFTVVPIHIDHALRYRLLPLHHRDPFDRMLVAQAQVEGLAILSADPSFNAYDVEVVPV